MRSLLVGLVLLAACGGGGADGDPPAITGFAATPNQLEASTPTDVTWSWSYSNDPDPVPTCKIDGVGEMDNGGHSSLTLAASSTYTLRCTNENGTGTAVALVDAVLDPVAPELGTLTATPNSVVTNTASDVTFAWTYTNQPAPAPSCTLDHGIGAVESGVAKSITLAAGTQLTLTCANSAGMATKTVMVNTVAAAVAPVLATFTATPNSVVIGTASTVTWAWTYTGTPTPAPTCSINQGIGAMTSGGTSSLTLAASTTYTLTCTNSAGSNTKTVTVNAAAGVAVDIATFTVDPSTVPANTATTVTWAWTYNGTPNPAATCAINNGIGPKTTGGTSSVNLAADTTYTLTCTNGATQMDTATVNITVQ